MLAPCHLCIVMLDLWHSALDTNYLCSQDLCSLTASAEPHTFMQLGVQQLHIR